MKFQRTWTPAFVVAVVSLTAGGWLLQQSGGDQDSVFAKARLLDHVHRLVAERYVDQVDPAELYQMAIDGMLIELGDPYTVFLSEDDYQDLHLSTTGNYGGLGIRIDEQAGWITVVGVLPNTPAERRGLQTGDKIIEVEGESAEGWSADDAVARLRGERGEPVTIKVGRLGLSEPLAFTIVREEIHVEAVNAFMLTEQIGFVRLNTFSKQSVREMRASIDELLAEGMSGLILDLRRNPGGLLDEGVAISDLFLPKGVEVVATQSRLKDQNHEFVAPGPEAYPGLPVVVMVDGYSASASEIVAGALQDHDRALVLGTTTFGKGSVQTLYTLPDNNHLKLTTAGWYTPSGRSIHRARDPRQEFAEMATAAAGIDGSPVATEDLTERDVYYTDSGRTVYGGGGITPDIVIVPDTLTVAEREFAEALARSEVSLWDAGFQFGLRWQQGHPDLTGEFAVTPAMLKAFYTYLTEEAGAEVERALYENAASYVEFVVSDRLANVAFGEDVRLRRSLTRNSQVSTAVELLTDAETTAQLFVLAEARLASDMEAAELEEGMAGAETPDQEAGRM